MKIDIEKILAKSPKERVLVLINHQAEISLNKVGFLSEEDIIAIVASFKTEKENKVYSKYREIFKKAQHFLISINQIHLICKEEVQKLDKLVILKRIMDDIKNNQVIELSDIPTISLIFKGNAGNSDLESSLIPGYKEIIERHQINLKSAIQAFRDALKEHSFKVKAFERTISSIEQQQEKDYRKNFLDSILGEEIDYKSVEVNYEQCKKFRETHL